MLILEVWWKKTYQREPLPWQKGDCCKISNMHKKPRAPQKIVCPLGSTFDKLPSEDANQMCPRICIIIQNQKPTTWNLSVDEWKALTSLRSAKSILVTTAEKANVSADLIRSEYRSKVRHRLDNGPRQRIKDKKTSAILNRRMCS